MSALHPCPSELAMTLLRSLDLVTVDIDPHKSGINKKSVTDLKEQHVNWLINLTLQVTTKKLVKTLSLQLCILIANDEIEAQSSHCCCAGRAISSPALNNLLERH